VDDIGVFGIDPQTGKLSPLGHTPTGGKTPRGFGVDPSGKYLLAANQSSDTVVLFRIDAGTGLLSQVGVPAEVPHPVAVAFVPVAAR